MDNASSELTDKIRTAIKEKLVEINAFVDDELPDYIMILVANKRSKAHMEKDLSLFLGNDTVSFTTWLWDLVNNLKVNSKVISSKPNKTDEEKVQKNNSQSDEETDVLDYDPTEQGDLDQSDENSLPGKVSTPDVLITSKVSEVKSIFPQRASNDQNEKLKKNVNHRKTSPKSAKIHPVQPFSRTFPLSTSERGDEYDPTKPDFTGTVSSIVRISQKNYGRPATLQASKLLLRAVDDATKSVLGGKSIDEFYKPTPITVLSSNRKENNLISRTRNLVSVKMEPSFDFDSEILDETTDICVSNENSNTSNSQISEEESYLFTTSTQNTRTIFVPSITRRVNTHSISPVVSDLPRQSSANAEEETEMSPHFIVTLDGVDLSSFKRKYSDSAEESMEVDESFTVSDETEELVPEKRQKITERCKFWPACKNYDECPFYHPTVPCKCFPDCKFGDKCLYIHPNCKFDSLCSRKDCPYTHASKRKFPLIPVSTKVPVKSRAIKAVCKFYPKCAVKNCTFIHPKLCHFGTKCRSPMCPYSHFNIPSRNQLKWKADVL